MRGPVYGIGSIWNGSGALRPTLVQVQRALSVVTAEQLVDSVPGSQLSDWGGWRNAATLDDPGTGQAVVNAQWTLGDTGFARQHGVAMAGEVANLTVASLNAMEGGRAWRLGSIVLVLPADPPDVSIAPGQVSGYASGTNYVPWALAGAALIAVGVVVIRRRR